MKDIINGFYEYNVKLNKSELTIKTYIENIEKFISDYNFTTENLDRLSSSEFIQEWLNDQINKGYQPGTINKKKNIISVFANYLMLNDIIKSNKFKEMSAMRNDAVKTDSSIERKKIQEVECCFLDTYKIVDCQFHQ